MSVNVVKEGLPQNTTELLLQQLVRIPWINTDNRLWIASASIPLLHLHQFADNLRLSLRSVQSERVDAAFCQLAGPAKASKPFMFIPKHLLFIKGLKEYIIFIPLQICVKLLWLSLQV